MAKSSMHQPSANEVNASSTNEIIVAWKPKIIGA